MKASAYHDASAGNNGGAYRSTDVDIEAASEGGYDVGWTSAGEWLNYTVNVSAAGSYTVGLRIASPSGAAVHVGFNSPSSVWSATSLPATGGWQNWTTVNVPVTLAAGVQQLTLLLRQRRRQPELDRSVTPSQRGAPPPPPPPPPPPSRYDTVGGDLEHPDQRQQRNARARRDGQPHGDRARGPRSS